MFKKTTTVDLFILELQHDLITVEKPKLLVFTICYYLYNLPTVLLLLIIILYPLQFIDLLLNFVHGQCVHCK